MKSHKVKSRSLNHGPSQRQLQVGEEVRHVLASVLSYGESRDPELAGILITITEVRMSPDLRYAAAFVMPLGGQKIKEVVAALNRGAATYRMALAQKLKLRFTPEVRFLADESFQEASKIHTLLLSDKVRKDIEAPDTNAEEIKEESVDSALEPTRFGDWEKKGRCIDF